MSETVRVPTTIKGWTEFDIDLLRGLAGVLVSQGGPNYVEMSFKSPDDDRMIVVTVAWADGKTPHQMRVEAEEKLAAAIRPAEERGER